MKRESQQISRISQIFFIRVIRIIRSCFFNYKFHEFHEFISSCSSRHPLAKNKSPTQSEDCAGRESMFHTISLAERFLLLTLRRRFGCRLLCRVHCGLGYLACGSCVTHGFLLSFFETLCCDIVVALRVNIAYAFFDARRESQPPSGVGIS